MRRRCSCIRRCVSLTNRSTSSEGRSGESGSRNCTVLERLAEGAGAGDDRGDDDPKSSGSESPSTASSFGRGERARSGGHVGEGRSEANRLRRAASRCAKEEPGGERRIGSMVSLKRLARAREGKRAGGAGSGLGGRVKMACAVEVGSGAVVSLPPTEVAWTIVEGRLNEVKKFPKSPEADRLLERRWGSGGGAVWFAVVEPGASVEVEAWELQSAHTRQQRKGLCN